MALGSASTAHDSDARLNGNICPPPYEARWGPQEREQPVAAQQAPSATAASAPVSPEPPMAQQQQQREAEVAHRQEQAAARVVSRLQ